MDVEWGTQRIINLYLAWRTQLVASCRGSV